MDGEQRGAALRTYSSLADDLELQQVGDDVFVGRCHQGAVRRIFGGHLAAQALTAAARTAEPHVHSMHVYFLAAGDPRVDVTYRVERMRDGKSYANRRVIAYQYDEPIFTLSASFKRMQDGFDRFAVIPQAPPPEDLADPYIAWSEREPWVFSQCQWARVASLRWAPARSDPLQQGRTEQLAWMKVTDPLPDQPRLHTAALTYISDLTLAYTASRGVLLQSTLRIGPPTARIASLDHAMWFHRPFRADEWLLFVQHSPSSGDGRGLSTGEFWARDGQLVASATQESLLRPIGAPPESRPEDRIS